MSFLQKQLPGVHIEVAKDWYAAMNYTKKKDTAVPGTRVRWQIAVTPASALTLDDLLMMIADNVSDYDLEARVRKQDKDASE